MTTKTNELNEITTGWNMSVRQVNDLLTAIRDELVSRCGDYTWQIEGESGCYCVVAISGADKFTDGRGRTPRKALADFDAAREILASHDIDVTQNAFGAVAS